MARLKMIRVFPVLLLCLCALWVTTEASGDPCDDCGTNEYDVKFISAVYDNGPPPQDTTIFTWEVTVDNRPECCPSNNGDRRLLDDDTGDLEIACAGERCNCRPLKQWAIQMDNCKPKDIVGGQYGGATPDQNPATGSPKRGWLLNEAPFTFDGPIFKWKKGVNQLPGTKMNYTLEMIGNIPAGVAMAGLSASKSNVNNPEEIDQCLSMGPKCLSISGNITVGDCETCEIGVGDAAVGVLVKLFNSTWDLVQDQYTDNNGDYLFSGVDPLQSPYNVKVPQWYLENNTPYVGVAPANSIEVLVEDTNVEDINFCVFTAFPTFNVSGYVTATSEPTCDPDVGGPIDVEGVTVVLLSNGEQIASTMTDGTGFYEFTDLVSNDTDYTVEVQGPLPEGFVFGSPSETTFTRTCPNVTPEVFNVCLVPEEVGSIYGKVVGICKLLKHPAKGVRVMVRNTSHVIVGDTYTNKYGSFRVLDLPAGTYQVMVIPPLGDRVLSDNPVNVTVEDGHVFAGKFFLEQCLIKPCPQYPQMCGGCSCGQGACGNPCGGCSYGQGACGSPCGGFTYGHGACGYPVGYGQGESMAPPGDSEASWKIPQEYKFDEKIYWWEVFPKDFQKSESESESKFDKVWDWKADEWWLEE